MSDQIDAYVRFVEELPTELAAVRVYLGVDAAVDAADVHTLFVQLRAHADSWGPVSEQARRQLRELSSTADRIVKDGNGLLRGLDSPRQPDTQAKIERLAPYVDGLKGATVADSDATARLIGEFRTRAAELEAKLAGLVDTLKANAGQVGREQTIEPMIDAYRAACARIVALFGEGTAAAAAIQRQVAQTLGMLTSRRSDLQGRKRLTYAAGRLFVQLQGLGYAALDAQSALTQAWLSSAAAHAKLETAVDSLASIRSEDALLVFYISWRETLRDWTQVRDDAARLYRDF